MIEFLRVWAGSARAVKCKHCRKPIQLVIDDRGKYLPFRADAPMVRQEKTDRGTFNVFDPSDAFHECAKKFRRFVPLASSRGVR